METLEIGAQYLKPAIVGIYTTPICQTEKGIFERLYDMWMRLAGIVKSYVSKSETHLWLKTFFFKTMIIKEYRK